MEARTPARPDDGRYRLVHLGGGIREGFPAPFSFKGVIGLQFISPRHAGLIVCVREPEEQFFSDGRSRIIRPALNADFAEESVDETYQGQDGDPAYRAMRGGGWFDSDVAAARHQWTEEEKKAVEQRLIDISNDGSGDVQLYVPAKPTPPWPAYDDMHHEQIPKFAEQAGLVTEALIYEQRSKARPRVVEKLQELVELASAEADLTAA